MNRAERGRPSGPPLVRLLSASRWPLALSKLLEGVLAYAKENGWLFGAHSDVPYQGVIALDTRTDAQIAAELGGSNVPVVRCHFPLSGTTRHAVVTCDERQIGRAGGEHLRELGTRHFVFAGVDWFVSRQREAGFVEALPPAGQPVLTTAQAPGGGDRWPLDMKAEEFRPLVRRWLSALPRPLSIMSWDDGTAVLVGQEALALGLTIPEDVALLGVNNSALVADLLPVPLSSVDLDQEGIGYQAAALLDRLMAREGDVPRVVRVPPRGVQERRSTQVLAVEDPDVAAALRWLRDHALQRVRLSDVEEVIECSRATLDRRFRRALGHSMGRELQRLRLHRARDLLVHTRRSMLAIAMECGFSDLPHFSKGFKQAYGMPPHKYRQMHAG